MRSVRLLISGRVQGVGYRDWAQREAAALGLSGWVRNLRDGRVEAVASGDGGAVGIYLERVREGPHMARVDHVDVSPAEPISAAGFEVRSTV
ncbi:acylphosphatase [Sphingomonas tabacisoli]|uniref:acylphosphatase n=1 Tax=Sphingomonas tabacisoli TaxID=2249466 RepID=A0ABW4I4D4_9SPHN